MNASELERLMRSDGGSPGREWPPPSEQEQWERARFYRLRYENSRSELWRYRTDLHVLENPAATQRRYRDYTPVPYARDLARLSASLLFSESPQITVTGSEASQARLDEWRRFNRLDEFLSDTADDVAATGSAALRVIRDDRVSLRFPLVLSVPADRIIWSERHRFVEGGICVIEVSGEGQNSSERWRLLEHHGPGFVRRALFKGDVGRLGKRVSLDTRPEFRDLRQEERTGLDRPTLIRWDNVPGGHSDLSGLEPLLDAADDGESTFRMKARASKPRTFVNRRLADQRGDVDLDGVILVGDSLNPVESPEALATVVQGRMESADHREYTDHLRELIVSLAGYSLASWGLDQGGRADSGRALKLRQLRTLLTRSGKERMAVRAIGEAAGIGLAMMSGLHTPPEVTVELADGLPDDPLELAEEAATLRAADAASTETIVRTLRPDWSAEQIEEEVLKIELTRGEAGVELDSARNAELILERLSSGR